MHRHHLAIFLSFLAILSVIVPAVAATPADNDLWGMAGIEAEGVFANILWDKGQETLYILPSFPPLEGCGWVIPVPAPEESVSVAWEQKAPQFVGRTPESVLHEHLVWAVSAAQATQLYPIIYDMYGQPRRARTQTLPAPEVHSSAQGTLAYSVSPVGNVDELKTEATRRGIALSEGAIAAVQPYMDTKHTFIFVYPLSLDAYRAVLKREYGGSLRTDADFQNVWYAFRETPALKITFPAAEPTLPTHVGGGTWVPYFRELLAVSGYVDWPAAPAPPQISGFSLKWIRGQWEIPGGGDFPIVPYTRILSISPPEELRFTPKTGNDFDAADHYYWLLANPLFLAASTIAWTALCSYACAGIAGLIFAGRWNRFAKTGLWNLGTLLVFWFQLERGKWANLRFGILRRGAFLLTFTGLFTGAQFLAIRLLDLWLGPYASYGYPFH